MPLKIVLMIAAAIAANWFFYEQPILTRIVAGILSALIVAFACDRWLQGNRKNP